MASVEEVLKEFQQLPDWNRFPMPEVVYEKFGIKKPKPASMGEIIGYQPPPSESLNPKIEERPPAPGGVREIKDFQSLPVKMTMLLEDGTEVPVEELKPAPKKEFNMEIINRILNDNQLNFDAVKLTLPTEGTKTESQPESGLSSQGLSDA